MAYQVEFNVKFDGRRIKVVDDQGMTKYSYHTMQRHEWFDASLTPGEREEIIDFLVSWGFDVL